MDPKNNEKLGKIKKALEELNLESEEKIEENFSDKPKNKKMLLKANENIER
jgi:hypothetical protein